MSEQWEAIKPSRHAMLIPGTDQARFRLIGSEEWSIWHHIPNENGPVSVNDFVLSRTKNTEWEFRRPVRPTAPATPQPQEQTMSQQNQPSGSKYHRTIMQTLPGEFQHLAITVDVYDVLQAFGVTCPALQHAVKKLLCAGLRGQKSAAQDIDEAANSCRRAIELLRVDS